jgi:hypothetical protein
MLPLPRGDGPLHRQLPALRAAISKQLAAARLARPACWRRARLSRNTILQAYDS